MRTRTHRPGEMGGRREGGGRGAARTCTHRLTDARTHRRMHARADAQTQTHARTDACSDAQASARTLRRLHSSMHARTHARTHARSATRTALLCRRVFHFCTEAEQATARLALASVSTTMGTLHPLGYLAGRVLGCSTPLVRARSAHGLMAVNPAVRNYNMGCYERRANQISHDLWPVHRL